MAVTAFVCTIFDTVGSDSLRYSTAWTQVTFHSYLRENLRRLSLAGPLVLGLGCAVSGSGVVIVVSCVEARDVEADATDRVAPTRLRLAALASSSSGVAATRFVTVG